MEFPLQGHGLHGGEAPKIVEGDGAIVMAHQVFAHLLDEGRVLLVGRSERAAAQAWPEAVLDGVCGGLKEIHVRGRGTTAGAGRAAENAGSANGIDEGGGGVASQYARPGVMRVDGCSGFLAGWGVHGVEIHGCRHRDDHAWMIVLRGWGRLSESCVQI